MTQPVVGMGRRHAPDERDRRFLLADHLRISGVVARRSHLWAMFDPPLDQGSTGTCVGHGWKHWLLTAPVIQADPASPPSAFDIYDRAIKVDEWTENDNDTARQEGTSVRAGAKVLQSQGRIGAYTWAFDVNTCANWLAGMDAEGHFVGGPAVIGVNWYGSMFDLDEGGFLRIAPTAQVEGGHCVLLTGWNEKRGFAYGINSWGRYWGRKGRFYMPGEVLDRLIREDGEVCTSVELRVARADATVV